MPLEGSPQAFMEQMRATSAERYHPLRSASQNHQDRPGMDQMNYHGVIPPPPGIRRESGI